MSEIGRDGQVYVLHNRVETIDAFADKLRKLVPEGKFIVSHGQLKPDQLETRIMDFKTGKYQVLVSSTIIENGVHEAARTIRTGQLQQSNQTVEDFRGAICERISAVADCSRIQVDVRTFDSFSSSSTNTPLNGDGDIDVLHAFGSRSFYQILKRRRWKRLFRKHHRRKHFKAMQRLQLNRRQIR